MVAESWADVDDEFPQSEIIDNNDGTKTMISYKLNDDKKKVKVTQKVKRVVIKERVHPAVAERRKWKKYGAEKGKPPGPDFATTNIGEPVQLKLSFNHKEAEREDLEAAKEEPKKKSGSVFKCRYCGGEHFTSKCPHKDTLGAMAETTSSSSAAAAAAASSTSAAPDSKPGAYVPVHLRNRKPGDPSTAGRNKFERDDSTTLRFSQLNEIVNEDMIREELLLAFRNSVQRVNLVRDRTTGRSKGLAFVVFNTIEDAERALGAYNGKGYHNLILSVDWSKPRKS